MFVQYLNIKAEGGTPLVVQGLRLHAPNVGGLGSIPGQGTRSHTPQLRSPHAAKKTQCNQINNKYLFFKKLRVSEEHPFYKNTDGLQAVDHRAGGFQSWLPSLLATVHLFSADRGLLVLS